ncbi:dihydrofolate reductase family protein [Paeniglutamicibacter sp. NPDC012692]|uniref:dihydrofolate reductase family protein n=1 Tax=Paeniglutamicibacter sp. NPDC012692 TaxID=3364388 RepID=UPI003678EA87
MRKVIVCNISSLDGYFAGVGGNPLVLNMDAALDALNLEHMRSAGTVLLGRASFELFRSFWPNVADAPEDPANPGLSETNRVLSRLYGEIPKLVVGDSCVLPVDNAWHDSSRVIPGSEIDRLLRIEKAGVGGDIVVFASHLLWNVLL